MRKGRLMWERNNEGKYDLFAFKLVDFSKDQLEPVLIGSIELVRIGYYGFYPCPPPDFYLYPELLDEIKELLINFKNDLT